ncbi:MAG TPA: tryptophan--tRNA ligase, partial [bacterium (Candidatus Stahlbacteria)]|nr:tryptophan--tRNA ligase [Candidatus Stahlbacteria bacterium]
MKRRILSGMRTTGPLHLGNYFGALKNWVTLQDDFECYFEVADLHGLTTEYQDTNQYETWVTEMIIDWLIAGIDPQRSVILIQSHIPAHTQLSLIFSMLVTVARLQRNPTIKEQARGLGLLDQISYGHLGYPVLQASDILLYRGEVVPVGEDQLPHLEIAREIARRFNSLYGRVFPEPEPILTRYPRLPGIDGQRMSKSLGNTIVLSEDPASIKKKVMNMFTDPTKIKKNDPGHPKDCPVNIYHELFSEDAQRWAKDCQQGRVGCVDH